MREIGRLREIVFRAAGGGTGLECDIDEFDTMEPTPCRQMIVWNPEDREIIGGYRFILGEDIRVEDGVPHIATAHMFHFSEQFLKEYLPDRVGPLVCGAELSEHQRLAALYLCSRQSLGWPRRLGEALSADQVSLRQGDDVSIIR